MVMNWDAFRRLGDPWCRLPGVECRSAVPAPLCTLCRHRGAPDGLWCTMLLLATLSPFYRGQGVDCKPGRRHILHWPMSARGRKLYPPQKAPCALSALHCSTVRMACTCLQCIFSKTAAHSLEKCRWSPAGARLHSTMSRYLLVVRQLYSAAAAVEWSPGIAISPIATRHAADPPASS